MKTKLLSFDIRFVIIYVMLSTLQSPNRIPTTILSLLKQNKKLGGGDTTEVLGGQPFLNAYFEWRI